MKRNMKKLFRNILSAGILIAICCNCSDSGVVQAVSHNARIKVLYCDKSGHLLNLGKGKNTIELISVKKDGSHIDDYVPESLGYGDAMTMFLKVNTYWGTYESELHKYTVKWKSNVSTDADSLNVTIQGPFLIHYKKDVLYNGKKISLWDNADYGLKMDFYDRFREVKDNIYRYKGGMDTIALLDQQVLTLIIPIDTMSIVN
ncbi:hypothetical protein TFUB20_01256 [Tannerella forsythia]|uniref:Uncharacterized protein n=2 Tax=Tannerella forsythia TaxID=28112 RepID=A0A1D3ULU6_TANFO|nr:hypothetical protein TFUB20_01256 [Tannerella forsythia]